MEVDARISISAFLLVWWWMDDHSTGSMRGQEWRFTEIDRENRRRVHDGIPSVFG